MPELEPRQSQKKEIVGQDRIEPELPLSLLADLRESADQYDAYGPDDYGEEGVLYDMSERALADIPEDLISEELIPLRDLLIEIRSTIEQAGSMALDQYHRLKEMTTGIEYVSGDATDPEPTMYDRALWRRAKDNEALPLDDLPVFDQVVLANAIAAFDSTPLDHLSDEQLWGDEIPPELDDTMRASTTGKKYQWKAGWKLKQLVSEANRKPEQEAV